MGGVNKYIAPVTKKIDPVFRKVESKFGLTALMPEIPKPRAPVAPASEPDTSVADRSAANADI